MAQDEKNEKGSPQGEIEELRAKVAELERAGSTLAAMFGAMGDIIIEIDWSGRVVNVAPTKPDLAIVIKPDQIGALISDIVPQLRADEIVSGVRGAIETGGPVSVELSAPVGDHSAWFLGTAWPSSEKKAVLALRDVTERRQMEEAVHARQDEMIRAQSAALAELSTPLIPISEDIVVMPLIGLLDSQRAQQVMSTLLEGISKSGAAVAILDITGVSVVDTQVANGLIRAARAAALLGAEVVLTGIRPEVARTLVGLGADLQDIVTRGTLQSGIAYAMSRRDERESADDDDDDRSAEE